MNGRANRRAGAALLMTLLGVLVLEVVVAGAFHVAMQQRRIATAYSRSVQLQLAARSAAAAALAAWADLAADSLLVGTSVHLTDAEAAGIRTVTALHRVGPELFLLRSEARFPATGEAQAVAAIVRELTLSQFLGGIRAAAVARTAAVAGAVDGTPPPGCDAPGGAPAEVAPMVLAEPDTVQGDADAAAPRAFTDLSGLDLATAAEAPPEVRVVIGHSSLEADLDTAVLIVHGDLVVQPGVRFRGLLLVGGSLRLLPGASVYGAARVAGHLSVEDAVLRYDPCVLAALFRRHSILRGPLRAAPHWWIPSA